MVNSNGDYVIEMIVFFYTKPIPKTFTTENIRDYLLKPKQIVNECMLIVELLEVSDPDAKKVLISERDLANEMIHLKEGLFDSMQVQLGYLRKNP